MKAVAFKISASDADLLREKLVRRIDNPKGFVGHNANYEEGIIDAIDWLLGFQTDLARDILRLVKRRRKK